MTNQDRSCFVCGGDSSPYFKKNFGGAYNLQNVEYWKCQLCDFVFSKTHQEMPLEEWEQLNDTVHKEYQGKSYAENDPKWITRLASQSKLLGRLSQCNIIPHSKPWLDYACGDGKLVDMLSDYPIKVRKYDAYMSKSNSDYLTKSDLHQKGFDNVINTSFMEHVLTREPLDLMTNLVSSAGTLSIHTMVRETIPKDPSWFYLLPVHVAFYTNRSMQLLFEQWGFKESIYHLPSTMWIWFREKNDDLIDFLRIENRKDPDKYFFKDNFMDYWNDSIL